jgi:hypothetical protein
MFVAAPMIPKTEPSSGERAHVRDHQDGTEEDEERRLKQTGHGEVPYGIHEAADQARSTAESNEPLLNH